MFIYLFVSISFCYCWETRTNIGNCNLNKKFPNLSRPSKFGIVGAKQQDESHTVHRVCRVRTISTGEIWSGNQIKSKPFPAYTPARKRVGKKILADLPCRNMRSIMMFVQVVCTESAVKVWGKSCVCVSYVL